MSNSCKEFIELKSSGKIDFQAIQLSSSKSESNRALIINALAGNRGILQNLSNARDTRTMERLLQSSDELLDVLDAGTTMRFLTAYLAVSTKSPKVLTGSPRMQKRPIKILVEALNQIGASIKYQNIKGYPPLLISPFEKQRTDIIKIPSNISSQYISALLMVAPILPMGLTIELVGDIYSRPYILMTLEIMKKFGITFSWNGQVISIERQSYSSGVYTIESDWSGASYWYGLVSLAESGSVSLKGLRKASYQGDQAVVAIMNDLGVESQFSAEGVTLTKKANKSDLEIDFRNYPDLAQTVMVTAAGKKINLKMTGLESLKIKETDRIDAMQTELDKTGAKLIEDGSTWVLDSTDFKLIPETVFETYDDHRMAMAFAPLSMIAPIGIENPGVVEKSYPGFWDDLKSVGIITQ
ncbi:MAG: 3-phosphoshikimate 1-carboxyvinyltransferase [Bacteroidetes bacterium]|nr:3-phosphoshikimate 1-carboxyvinyltransferase [Bacteroidota bacterium]MDA1121917.1 3-phosphoshikimate 1-carboxyvinyltransferase [Bacteroidota bacterium]